MSKITQADWALAAKVMGFDSTEALRRHGHLRALHKQWAERLAAHRTTPSQRLDAATVERVIEALSPAWFASTYNHRQAVVAVRRALATDPHQHGGKGA